MIVYDMKTIWIDISARLGFHDSNVAYTGRLAYLSKLRMVL